MSISKDEAVAILVEHGYDARYEEGMPRVHYAPGNNPREDVERILKESGYNMSYGIIGDKKASDEGSVM